jgi:hypothetical protein
MKKIEVQMLLYYTLKIFFAKVQRNMLNPFGIILLYKVIGWFDCQDIDVKPKSSRLNPFYQHILCELCIYIYIYISYTCV